MQIDSSFPVSNGARPWGSSLLPPFEQGEGDQRRTFFLARVQRCTTRYKILGSEKEGCWRQVLRLLMEFSGGFSLRQGSVSMVPKPESIFLFLSGFSLPGQKITSGWGYSSLIRYPPSTVESCSLALGTARVSRIKAYREGRKWSSK